MESMKNLLLSMLLAKMDILNKEDLEKERYSKQELISGHEGQILTDIAANKLYLRHIPESYDSGRHKDAAKFIMLTSAFEWEFRRT